jgi:hypothetical protein
MAAVNVLVRRRFHLTRRLSSGLQELTRRVKVPMHATIGWQLQILNETAESKDE